MTKYYKEFTIPYYDTDREGYIKPENILSYMAETSSWHSDSIQAGFKVLSQNSHAWMLLRWEAEISSYPKAKEKVGIETWTSGFDRFYATREFLMKDHKGETLAKATTKWLFLDILKRRPKRIPDEIQKRYSFVEEFNFTDFSRMKELGENFRDSRLMRVRRSDIDSNNHVNNIRYMEWMQEGIDENIFDNKRIHRLGIDYRKEILPGDSFISRWGQDPEDSNRINHVISVDGKINAQGYTLWKEKDF